MGGDGGGGSVGDGDGVEEALMLLAITAVGVLGVLVLSFLWMTATGMCCMPAKRFFSRYVVRGMIKRGDAGLAFNYTQLDDLLFMGRLPKETTQLNQLRDEHSISALVTLNERWELPFYIAIAAIMGKSFVSAKAPDSVEVDGSLMSPEPDDPQSFNFCHLPTPDYCAPRQQDLWRGARWMQDQIGAGQTVYVHCNAGRGRSAVVVLCYLVLTKGLSAEEALQFVAEKRNIANLKAICGTRPQWRAVLKFEKTVAKQRAQTEAEAAGDADLGDGGGVGRTGGGGRGLGTSVSAKAGSPPSPPPLTPPPQQRGKNNKVAPLPRENVSPASPAPTSPRLLP